jgi:hypothetical protein
VTVQSKIGRSTTIPLGERIDEDQSTGWTQQPGTQANIRNRFNPNPLPAER